MTEPLQVGQFAIVDHEPVDRGPNAGIFEGKGPVDERAELFVLAEGTTPASEAFAGHVVTAVGNAWAGFDMSLSGCLTAAFREAESHIWDWNRKSVAQHQVSIGLTCFAHRGDHAIVAQAGPSVAFHLHDGELHAYFPRGDKARAIGSGAPPEPHLTKVDMHPGDRMLLISTSGVDELDQEVIAGILALPGQQALQDLYQRVRGLRHLTALLVAAPDRPAGTAPVTEPAAGDAPAPSKGPDIVIDATHETRRPGFQPSLFIEDEHEADVEAARNALVSISTRASARSAPHAPLSEQASIRPLQRAVGESNNIRDLADRIRARTEESAAARSRTPSTQPAASIDSGAPARPLWSGSPPAHTRPSATSVPMHQPPSNSAGRSRSFQRGLVGEPAVRNAAHSATPAPPVGELAAERTRRLQASTSSAIGAQSIPERGGAPLVRPRANMGGRWKGNGSLSGRRTATGANWINDRTLIIGAIVLLLIVGIFFIGPRVLGTTGPDPDELIAEASTRFSESRLTVDPGEQRAALSEAEALILQAHDAGGKTIESEQLFNQVAGALSSLDNVVRPAAVETVADLSEFGTQPVTPSEMEVGAGYVFLLDTGVPQVIAQPTGGAAASVIYTADPDASRDRPVAIAMLPDGLLVLDASQQLWLTFPGLDPSQAALNAPEGLTITDIAVVNDSLYVLDAPQAAIFRFARTQNGFESEPTVFLAAPGLAQAVRFLVDEEVITITADGTIHRYVDGAALALSQSGIDRKIASPQQLRSFDGVSAIAIPDPQEDRIVAIRRDGTFDRQYRHDAFTGLRAFAPFDGGAYVFSGGQVRRVTW